MILKFLRGFLNILWFFFFFFFFSKFRQILLKTNIFLKFSLFFSTVPQSYIDILPSFLQIPQIFFQRFTQGFNKITVKVCSNFYSDLLLNCLANFRSVFKFFLTLELFFSDNLLSVSPLS